MYAKGQGVAQNEAEAAKWYPQAAAQGDASAQYNLGVMFYSGDGVPQNHAEAAKWYQKSPSRRPSAAIPGSTC
jgi:uncharacterized protein